MKVLIGTIILACVTLVTSCVTSLNPIYTESDLTTESWLAGTWLEEKTGEKWNFTRAGEFGYTLVHTDSSGRKGKFDARLVRIEDKLFLDIFPIKSSSRENDVYREHFIPAHTFVHIVSDGSTVKVSYMEPRWLKEYLTAHSGAIRHEKVAGEIVLTSSTKEMQRFVLEHLKTHEAFSEPTEFKRMRGGS